MTIEQTRGFEDIEGGGEEESESKEKLINDIGRNLNTLKKEIQEKSESSPESFSDIQENLDQLISDIESNRSLESLDNLGEIIENIESNEELNKPEIKELLNDIETTKEKVIASTGSALSKLRGEIGNEEEVKIEANKGRITSTKKVKQEADELGDKIGKTPVVGKLYNRIKKRV